MSSAQEFSCVFCKEVFEDKETLQEHFRKHGDPKFNSTTRNKARNQNDQAVASDKIEDGEVVGCDVCEEVFPSISKAITHKHKVHPDQDTKHFCPWCGKLFTMKHLYNKHMLSNHIDRTKTDDNFYHCDCCNVDFFLPSAMVNHNRFFHRQDTELPSIGHSKKVKTFYQELIQIYYCPFCGEEYNNKVNLHKHMVDDHSDENQSPDEVLRCPLCDAVFYHLDAYEHHLSFHSSDDVYNDENEIILDIKEFSLESVPPIMERVEVEEPEADNEGIDKFLQLIMDDSHESGTTDMNDKHKSKKHKKHKKSKKSAITLDEFLNMNKDVFGDGLDVQGIEEVPTQQVLKKCKGKKDNTVKPVPASALAKLKKQGIIVKSNSSVKSPILNINKRITVNTANIVPTRIPVKESPKSVASHNEVLSKLLNQGNSQIKIVKKSSIENVTKDKTSNQSEPHNAKINSSEYITSTNTGLAEEKTAIEEMSKNSEPIDEKIKNLMNNDEEINDTEMQDCSNNSLQKSVDCVVNKDSNICTISNQSNDNDDLKANDIEDSKSDETPDTDPEEEDMPLRNEVDKYNTNENLEAKSNDEDHSEGMEEETQTDAQEQYQQANTSRMHTPNKSLKHLSSVFTVNPTYNAEDNCNINEKKLTIPEIDAEYMIDNMPSDIPKVLSKDNSKLTAPIASQIKQNASTKSLDALKNLNKHLIIKPCTTANSSSECNDENESDEENVDSEDSSPPNKNIINEKNNVHFKTPTCVTKLPSVPKPNQPLDIKKPILTKNILKESVKEEEDMQKSLNMDILKRLKNVTAKPISISTNTNQGPKTSQPTSSSRPVIKVEKNKHIDQDIEIYNIDDSDSDQEPPNEDLSTKQSVMTQKSNDVKTTASVNILKNISKNITVKQPNSPNKQNILNSKNEMHGESSRTNSDKNIRSPGSNENKQNIPKKQISMNLSNTLKKLGNNISIKSQYSSPDPQRYQTQLDDDAEDHFDTNDDESDSESTNNVKISEIHDEDEDLPSDTDMEYNENVVVQSPHASNSENEEEAHNNYSDEDVNEDFEREIKTNMLAKETVATKCLDNFKKNNSQLTIKSLNEKSGNVPQAQSSNNKKEEAPRFAKNLTKDMTFKKVKDSEKHEHSEVLTKNCNQSIASTSASKKVTNQVNTVKTVKTIQSETIIEEITTTVTKTIRTVNHSTKQVAQNANINTYRPRLISPNSQGKSMQGMMVKNAPTMGTKIRNAAPLPRPTIALPAKMSGQLVPMRPQNQIVPRQQTVFRPRQPGPSNIRKISPQVNVQKPVMGKPLRISPHAMNQSMKRPSEDTSGQFNSFKKPKDMIPSMDELDDDCDDATANYSSASSSRSDFCTATKIVKGKSVVTSTQARSEQHSEQMTKLNNMSGIKIVRTSAKQASQVETKNDMCPTTRTALDAIERLQKQGLLIKKPRIDPPEESEHYSQESDEDYEEK